MHALAVHWHGADLIDHLHAFDDPTEHRVTVTVARIGGVQKAVVDQIDEELRGSRIRVGTVCRWPTVPRAWLNPLLASRGMGGLVAFCTISLVKLPP